VGWGRGSLIDPLQGKFPSDCRQTNVIFDEVLPSVNEKIPDHMQQTARSKPRRMVHLGQLTLKAYATSITDIKNVYININHYTTLDPHDAHDVCI